jgi:hypothetical protein
MKPVDIQRRVRQVAWPAPPADLRARVLSAVPATSPAVSWSDRVWFSRGWRLAAAATFVALLALEQFAGSSASSARAPGAPVLEPVAAVAEAVREVGLPADQAAALARRSVSPLNRARAAATARDLVLEGLGIDGGER